MILWGYQPLSTVKTAVFSRFRACSGAAQAIELQNLTCMLIFDPNITDREDFDACESRSCLKTHQNPKKQHYLSI